MEPKEMIHL